MQQTNKDLYRAFLLLNELSWLYWTPREDAPEHLDALARLGLQVQAQAVRQARPHHPQTIRKHKAGVLAAVELGLSNGRLEGLNSKIRLLSHRAYGFHSPDALIATIYLCCAAITIPPRTMNSPPNREENPSNILLWRA